MSQTTLFSREVINASTKSTAYEKLEAGKIHKDCLLDLPLVVKDDGTVIITFSKMFKDKDGNDTKKSIGKWLQDPTEPMQFVDRDTGEKQSYEEAYARETKKLIAYFQVLADLVDKTIADKVYETAKSFTQATSLFVKYLNPVLEKAKPSFNVKVIATATGNAAFSYNPHNSIELFEGEDAETRLKFTSKELMGLNNPTNKTDNAIVPGASQKLDDLI